MDIYEKSLLTDITYPEDTWNTTEDVFHGISRISLSDSIIDSFSSLESSLPIPSSSNDVTVQQDLMEDGDSLIASDQETSKSQASSQIDSMSDSGSTQNFGRTKKQKQRDGKKQRQLKKRNNKPYYRLSPRVEKFPQPEQVLVDIDIADIKPQVDGYMGIHNPADDTYKTLKELIEVEGMTYISWDGM